MDFSGWAEHLNNPYSLFGFVVLVMATIAKLVLSAGNSISGPAKERLMNRVLIATLVVGVVAIVGGVTVSQTGREPSGATKRGATNRTHGAQSPIVNTGGGPSIINIDSAPKGNE